MRNNTKPQLNLHVCHFYQKLLPLTFKFFNESSVNYELKNTSRKEKFKYEEVVHSK